MFNILILLASNALIIFVQVRVQFGVNCICFSKKLKLCSTGIFEKHTGVNEKSGMITY